MGVKLGPSHGGKILTEDIQEQAAVENFNLKERKL